MAAKSGDRGPPRRDYLHAGRLLPEWADPNGTAGELSILQLCAAEGSDLPAKHVLIVGKSLDACLGKLDDVRTEDKGKKYKLFIRNKDQVQRALNMTQLLDGTPITVDYHPSLNRVRAMVYCPEAIDLEDEELLDELKQSGAIDVRRIKTWREKEPGRKDRERVNSPLFSATFNATTAPKHVKIGPLIVPTRTWYPNPRMCFGCFGMNHVKANCKVPARCRNCAGQHPLDQPCTAPTKCANCEGPHQPTSWDCRVYRFERLVIKTKVDNGISYAEARKLCGQTTESSSAPTSYAGAVQQRLVNAQALDSKDQIILELRKQLAETQQQLAQLMEKVASLEATKKPSRKHGKKKQQEEMETDSEMSVVTEMVPPKSTQAPKRKPEGSSRNGSPTGGPSKKAPSEKPQVASSSGHMIENMDQEDEQLTPFQDLAHVYTGTKPKKPAKNNGPPKQ